MRTVPPYVTEQLARQRERERRKLADRYGLRGPRRWPRRLAGRRQNQGPIQPARTCPASRPRAGDGGSAAA